MIEYAFIGDDFTGAVDSLWQFQRAGLRTTLLTPGEIPDADELSDYDVVGVATTMRSMAPREMAEQFAVLSASLLALGPRVLQYKVCSTFDSSPEVGSIGQVVDSARMTDAFSGLIPVVVAQPDFGRYTAFGHHFATEDAVIRRLDRHPPMQNHSVTPMLESDLRVHLGRQTMEPIVGVFTLTLDDAQLADAFEAAERSSQVAVVDAVTEGDLRRVGSALGTAIDRDERAMFAIGSGGLSWALGSRHADRHAVEVGQRSAAIGPVLAVSGSRSDITNGQIAYAEEHGWESVDLLPDPKAAREKALKSLAAGRNTIVYSTRGSVSSGPRIDDLGAWLGRIVRAAARERLVRRAVIMGGDSSGEAAIELGARRIRILSVAPSLPTICVVDSDDDLVDGLEVVFKGGQLGDPDFLELVRRGGR